MLSKELIKADIIAAKQAIDYYEQKQIKDIKNVAAYHLQQAAEKLLKYQIYKAEDNPNNKQLYVHDLTKLIDYAEAKGLEVIIPVYISDHLNKITDWEAGSRYDIGFAIRIDTLKRCYSEIAEWEKKVK